MNVDPKLLLPGHITVGQAVERYGVDHVRSVVLPNGLTKAQMDEWKRIRDSRFFLVRNRGAESGERYRCTRHSFEAGVTGPVYHEFFTTMCVDRPWRGLEDALYGYVTITKDEGLARKIERFAPNGLPSHPQTFGPHASSDGAAEVVAFVIGTLEPISESRAQWLAAEINSRRPPKPFVL